MTNPGDKSSAVEPGAIRIGTSGFTAPGWPGTFYPRNLPASNYLSYYASQFNTVELVSTLYGPPRLSTVQNWYSQTPPDFLFAVKMPRKITHEKVLVGCDRDLYDFFKVMDTLKEKLGPILIKFSLFNKNAFASAGDFLQRLVPFLKNLPAGYRFAVGIQNQEWAVPELLDLLRSRGVALVLTGCSGKSCTATPAGKVELITADFSYIRLVGDRKAMNKLTEPVARPFEAELSQCAATLRQAQRLSGQIYAYATNSYDGFAPRTAKSLSRLLSAHPSSYNSLPGGAKVQSRLFE